MRCKREGGSVLPDFCRHDEAVGVGVECDVARHQADVGEHLGEFAVFLVAEGLDGRRVNDALVVAQGRRDGGDGDDGLAGGRVRRNKD